MSRILKNRGSFCDEVLYNPFCDGFLYNPFCDEVIYNLFCDGFLYNLFCDGFLYNPFCDGFLYNPFCDEVLYYPFCDEFYTIHFVMGFYTIHFVMSSLFYFYRIIFIYSRTFSMLTWGMGARSAPCERPFLIAVYKFIFRRVWYCIYVLGVSRYLIYLKK
jgi:hypothetical protein